MSDDIELVEGGPPKFRRLDDAVGDALAATGAVNAVRIGGGDWEIAPADKVGVVKVGDVTVWIKPKVGISRLLYLLGYAKNPGWRADLVTMAEEDDLVPALARAFADQADRALQPGVLQGYSEVDDSLTVLRGRLREQDQLRQRFGIAVPLLVRYDDHTVDIAENQILRGAAELLLHLPGVPTKVRARLRRIRGALIDVSVVPPGRPLPMWRPDRLNERYHVALWLAEVLLRHNAVDQRPGSVRVSGFLVTMWKVYEDFLTAAFTRAFRPHGGTVRAQDIHHLDVGQSVTLKPDIVWYVNDQPRAVIDAKYKVEKPAGFPEADVYQLLAYCTAMRLRDGHLVYAKGNADQGVRLIRNTDIRIHTHTVDLSLLPDQLLAHVDALAREIASVSTTALVA